jgi:hypothetical protein
VPSHTWFLSISVLSNGSLVHPSVSRRKVRADSCNTVLPGKQDPLPEPPARSSGSQTVLLNQAAEPLGQASELPWANWLRTRSTCKGHRGLNPCLTSQSHVAGRRGPRRDGRTSRVTARTHRAVNELLHLDAAVTAFTLTSPSPSLQHDHHIMVATATIFVSISITAVTLTS